MQTIYKNILPSLLGLLLLLAPNTIWAQEPESVTHMDSKFSSLEFKLLPEWTGLSDPIPCTADELTGVFTVHQFKADATPDNKDITIKAEPDDITAEGVEVKIPTEMVRLDLQGPADCNFPSGTKSAPITVSESPFKKSDGFIYATKEDPNGNPVINSSNPASSFFDIFVEIEVDLSALNMGTRTVFAKKAVRVFDEIVAIPPQFAEYLFKGILVDSNKAGDPSGKPDLFPLDLFNTGRFSIPDFSDTSMDPHVQILFESNQVKHIVETSTKDESPPICRLSKIVLSKTVEVIAHDPEWGIESIQCETENARAFCAFTQGTRQQVTLRALKNDKDKGARFSVWITDRDGNTTHCDPVVTRLTATVPESFSLEQNYPNPVNPTTNIPFKVAEKRHVMLTVYDVLGREVATLVDRKVQPGTYEVRWDATGLSSGVYVYQLKAGRYTESREMTLVK